MLCLYFKAFSNVFWLTGYLGVLFNFHVFVSFVLFLLLIFSFISLWLKDTWYNVYFLEYFEFFFFFFMVECMIYPRKYSVYSRRIFCCYSVEHSMYVWEIHLACSVIHIHCFLIVSVWMVSPLLRMEYWSPQLILYCCLFLLVLLVYDLYI